MVFVWIVVWTVFYLLTMVGISVIVISHNEIAHPRRFALAVIFWPLTGLVIGTGLILYMFRALWIALVKNKIEHVGE